MEAPIVVDVCPRAIKRCGRAGCDEPMPCPVHTHAPWQGSTRHDTLPDDWPSRVAYVLARDPVCTLQLAGCTGDSTQVDHAGPRTDHDVGSLRGVCGPCHASRSGAQGAAGRVRRQPRPRG